MLRKISSLLFVFLSIQMAVQADEGMWLLNKLHQINLNEKGIQLSPDEIYSINQSSLKDGIVGLTMESNPFRFFCSGEIVSNLGLFITNHHCGYRQIQQHSSIENDYLSNGFWAQNHQEELYNKGMAVSILVEIRDVSDRVLPELETTSNFKERNEKLNELSKIIADEVNESTHYKSIVKSMYEGNQFYLFIYEVFTDIRLVGAPPSSIGKYGGDTDNWMWPRHTGDFTLFRVYSGPDGKPASFSPDNIPYVPKHHFPISLQGYEKDDFAFVIGFPGTTDRYLTSFGIRESLDDTYPVRIALRGMKLDVMKKHMNASDKVRIQYASKYAGISNYWKYFIGQTKGLKALKVYDKKQAFEAELSEWIAANPKLSEKYGNALIDIETSFAEKQSYAKTIQFYGEGLFGIEALTFPRRLSSLKKVLEKKDSTPEELEKAIADARASAESYFKDYDKETDIDLFVAMMSMFTEGVPLIDQPEMVVKLSKKAKGDFEKIAKTFFEKSIFVDQEKFMAFLDKPNAKKIEKDPFTELWESAYAKYIALNSVLTPVNEKLASAKRLFVDASMQFHGSKELYPDANSTPRFTYGYVGDYKPADAVYYSYYTTIDGIMEKEDPNNDEFIVDERFKQLYQAKDFGIYAAKDGNLWVNFITNNDITGGNSGSGVFNARGELIGTAFDGNWESMSGDIAFEPELQKCINVDIRYTLWVIDKYAGASHLINEMTLVR